MRSITRPLGCLVLLAAILVGSRPALAQGTSRTFADPLSFDEMIELLAPLELSEAQRSALANEHERYLDGCRNLRLGAIESYLADYGSMALAFRSDREEITEALKRARAIEREIAALDDGLLAAVGAMCSDGQRALLPRLAARRERDRLSTIPSSSHMLSFPSLRRMDLVDPLDDVEIPDEHAVAIDQMLAAYEASIVPLFRSIHEGRLDLPLASFDQRQAQRDAMSARFAELREEFDLTTEEGRRGLAEASRKVIEEETHFDPHVSDAKREEAIRADYIRLSQLNRRLLSDIRPLLDAEQSSRFERLVTQRAYTSLSIPGNPIERRVKRHLESSETPAELNEALAALLTEYRATRSSYVDRMIVAGEKSGFERGGHGFTVFLGGAPEPKEDDPTDLEKLRDEFRACNERTLETYAELTGEEVTAHNRHTISLPGGGEATLLVEPGDDAQITIETDGESPVQGNVTVFLASPAVAIDANAHGDHAMVADAVGAFEIVADDTFDAGELDFSFHHAGGGSWQHGWLPGPMDEDFVGALGDELDLDDTNRPLLDALYEDYRASYDRLEQEELAPARRATSGMTFFNRGSDDDEDVDPAANYDRVVAGMAAIAELDARFFDDVVLVVAPDEETTIHRAHRIRRRTAYGHRSPGLGMVAMESGSREDAVDLVDLLRGLELAEADRRAGMKALETWDRDMTELATARWSAGVEGARLWATRMAESMRQSEGDSYMVMMPPTEEDSPLGAAQRRVSQAREDMRRSTQTAEAAVRGALSDTGRSAFVDRYHRAAFPTVYRDRSSLDGTFTKARSIDLPEATRSRIEDIALDYRLAYEAICRRMIDRIRAFDDRPADDRAHGFDQSLFRDLQADNFDRRNLNERTRQELRDALGPEIAARLGLRKPE